MDPRVAVDGVGESDLVAQERLSPRIRDSRVRYPETMLSEQLEYLYGMMTEADQRPGADALRRAETLEAELACIVARLDQLADEELSRLKARLEAAGLATVTAPRF